MPEKVYVPGQDKEQEEEDVTEDEYELNDDAIKRIMDAKPVKNEDEQDSDGMDEEKSDTQSMDAEDIVEEIQVNVDEVVPNVEEPMVNEGVEEEEVVEYGFQV